MDAFYDFFFRSKNNNKVQQRLNKINFQKIDFP